MYYVLTIIKNYETQVKGVFSTSEKTHRAGFSYSCPYYVDEFELDVEL